MRNRRNAKELWNPSTIAPNSMQFVQQNVFHCFYLSHFHEIHQIQLDLLLKFDCYRQENASVLFCYSIKPLHL